MIRVALVWANGTTGQGGISRFCDYLVRASKGSPDLTLHVVATLPSQSRLLGRLLEGPALIRFAVQCRRGRYDVVHLNLAPHNSMKRKRRFQIAARLASVPTVVHLHGSDYDGWYDTLPPRRAAQVARLFDGAGRVIVCGDHWRRFVVERLGVDSDRVTVVYNGVPDDGALANPTNDPPRLITLGLVGERKGTDVLLAALARLPRDLDWRADIAGPGDIDAATRMRDELALTERVSFPGWWPEVEAREELATSDVFVLASRRENQPVAIVEAMAAGLPVVSTAIAAIPEVVEHEVTGLIVPPDDPDALATALEALLRSPARRLTMGTAARERYERDLTIDRCAALIHAVHRQVVADGTG